MLGNVWMSWYGTSFYLERDKKAIFLSRILVSLKINYFLDMFKQMRCTILDIPKEHTHTHTLKGGHLDPVFVFRNRLNFSILKSPLETLNNY